MPKYVFTLQTLITRYMDNNNDEKVSNIPYDVKNKISLDLNENTNAFKIRNKISMKCFNRSFISVTLTAGPK